MPNWSRDPRDKEKVGRGTLRKHADSKVWYFHYKGEDGRWKSTSTGHRDKAGAVEWATAFSMDLTRREYGIVEPDKRVSNDGIMIAFDEWLKYVESQRKAKTLKAYRSARNNLERYLRGRLRIRRLGQLDKQEILGFRQWLQEGKDRTNQRRCKKTCDNNLIILRAFLGWCVSMKKVRGNPVSEQRQGVQLFFKEPKARIETYTVSEYQAIITEAAGELRTLCQILGLTGMRISELAMLEWSDVDLEGEWLHVRVKTTHDGIAYSPKDSTDRKLPIGGELSSILKILRKGSEAAGYVIPGPAGMARADNVARAKLKMLKALSGPTGISAKKLTLHNFRRYFISQCADCGIDMACVMEWVGHDELKMVLHYYRLRDEHAKNAMRRYTTGTAQRPNLTQRDPSRDFGEHLGNSRRDQKSKGPQVAKIKPLTKAMK